MASRQDLINEGQSIRRRLAETQDPAEREHLRRRYEAVRQSLANSPTEPAPLGPLEQQQTPRERLTAALDAPYTRAKGPAWMYEPVAVVKKYGGLRIISVVLSVYTWAAMILISVEILTDLRQVPDLPYLRLMLVVSGVSAIAAAILLLGIAQALRVAVDVEENTRRTAEAVEKLLRQQGAGHD